MMYSSILAFSAFGLYASYAIGVKTVFRDPGEQTATYKLLLLGALATGLLIVYSLYHSDPTPLQFGISITGMLLSFALFLWTAMTIRSQKLSVAFSTDQPDFLIRSGPYRFLRHPFYFSYLLGYSSGIVAAPGWLSIGSSVYMLGIYLTAARFEEGKFANSELADEYQAYKSEVGILFPKLLKGKSNP